MVNTTFHYCINLHCSPFSDPVLLFLGKTLIIMPMRTEFRHFLTQS